MRSVNRREFVLMLLVYGGLGAIAYWVLTFDCSEVANRNWGEARFVEAMLDLICSFRRLWDVMRSTPLW